MQESKLFYRAPSNYLITGLKFLSRRGLKLRALGFETSECKLFCAAPATSLLPVSFLFRRSLKLQDWSSETSESKLSYRAPSDYLITA